MKKISVNDLPASSNVPSRLLSSEQQPIRTKSHKEVMREFNRDKWGSLLQVARKNKRYGLKAIETIDLIPKTKCIMFDRGELFQTTEGVLHRKRLAYIRSSLLRFVRNASALVELGAGYGGQILSLLQDARLRRIPAFAAELTPNGQALTALLAEREGLSVTVGGCDFRSLQFTNFRPPPGAILFTVYSAHYVPHMPERFVDYLCALQPAKVIHFEPVYELFPETTMLGLLGRKYMEQNDYTRNLLSVLRAGEKRKRCRVVSVDANVIGSPTLPISRLIWEPR